MALYQSNARLLRMALYANGAFSLLTGAACLLAPDSIARWIFASESSLFRLAAPGLVLPRATPKCTSENGSVMSVLPCGRARRWRESCKRRFAYASRLPSPDPR